jgi:sulfur carrier protein ThiS
VNVHVKLLGTLHSDYAGPYTPSGIRVELPAGACLTDLVDHLGISRERVGIATVNGILAKARDVIPAQAEVKLMQKIAGG